MLIFICNSMWYLDWSIDLLIDWLIDFDGMLKCLGLFYALSFRNNVNFMFIFILLFF